MNKTVARQNTPLTQRRRPLRPAHRPRHTRRIGADSAGTIGAI